MNMSTKYRYDASCCSNVSDEVHTTTYWRPGATKVVGANETDCCIEKNTKNMKKVNRYVLNDSGERFTSGSLKSNLSYAEYLRKKNKSIEQVVRKSVGTNTNSIQCGQNCTKYITTKNNKDFFTQGAVSSSARMERLRIKNLNKTLSCSSSNCDYAVRGAHLKDKQKGKKKLLFFNGCSSKKRWTVNNQIKGCPPNNQ